MVVAGRQYVVPMLFCESYSNADRKGKIIFATKLFVISLRKLTHMISATESIKVFMLSSILALFIPGCKKEDQQLSTNNQSVSATVTDNEASFSREGTNNKLTLQPNAKHSHDVYVAQRAGEDLGNENWVPELTIDAWTDLGRPLYCNAYIMFDSIVKIPVQSQVIKANLYLYTPSSSISTPQGNSGDNQCYVRRVTGSWDASTLTYNNQPGFTSTGQALLATSTSQWNYTSITDVTKLVQFFVNHPDKNFGFNISLVTLQAYRSILFGSSEQDDKNYRPKLIVVYQ